MRKATPAPERFWPKVRKTDTCWLWTAALNQNGYGRFLVAPNPPVMSQAHRFAYELLRGPIPDGLSLDHLCRVRNCVNPDHLEPVTQRTNVLRGINQAARQAKQTRCIRDHPLPPYRAGRKRVCPECQRMHAKRRWQKELAQRQGTQSC